LRGHSWPAPRGQSYQSHEWLPLLIDDIPAIRALYRRGVGMSGASDTFNKFFLETKQKT
jgi:hypothetical protein